MDNSFLSDKIISAIIISPISIDKTVNNDYATLKSLITITVNTGRKNIGTCTKVFYHLSHKLLVSKLNQKI